MQNSIFITGNSGGIGYALTELYLQQGWNVYGLSRRGCQGLSGELHDIYCDLSAAETIAPALQELLTDVKQLDLIILNAGVLGEIREITKTPLDDIQHVMDINVWANKLMLDWLLQADVRVKQVVSISSGAAMNGHKGWSAYSLSKAALNILTRLYAAEFPDTHFTALAPGLVDTAMQDYLCDEGKVSSAAFPSVKKIRDARGTMQMPTPATAAKNIVREIPGLMKIESGSYIDLRNL